MYKIGAAGHHCLAERDWGWLNYVMECFNFELKFREWVYMLFKKGKACIKTNGFISKFFAISRSARQ
jgi:hypothetical protein